MVFASVDTPRPPQNGALLRSLSCNGGRGLTTAHKLKFNPKGISTIVTRQSCGVRRHSPSATSARSQCVRKSANEAKDVPIEPLGSNVALAQAAVLLLPKAFRHAAS